MAHVQKLYTDYRAATQQQQQQQQQQQEAVNNVINSFEAAVERFPKCVETYALFAQVLSDQVRDRQKFNGVSLSSRIKLFKKSKSTTVLVNLLHMLHKIIDKYF